MPATKPDHARKTQPQEADGYAADLDEFLGKLNGSTSRSAGRVLTKSDFHRVLLNTFGGPDGKIVLAWLHATAGTRKPAFSFGPRGADTHAAAVKDGRRGLVWEIEANLEDARSGDAAIKPATSGPGKPRARRRGA